MNKKDCESARDSMSKALYDKLFNWLVKKLNKSIVPDNNNPQIEVKTARKSVSKSDNKIPDNLSIGLLDIFGFENFQVNSFEQICINFTNEKLQQLYISYIFKTEEQEFIDEGLKEYLCNLTYRFIIINH